MIRNILLGPTKKQIRLSTGNNNLRVSVSEHDAKQTLCSLGVRVLDKVHLAGAGAGFGGARGAGTS